MTIINIEDIQPGSQFRQYQMLERVGYGGQAVVWSAFDENEQRVVAVKLSQTDELTDTEQHAENQAFERLSQTIAQLRHPNILPLYDYGITGRLRFLVMPYLAAGSLRGWISTAKLSQRDILKIVAQITSALDHLHQQQIVHRDLKPTNILIDYSYNLYLTDFGLARILSQTTRPLHTGRGTPSYASPEQISASAITPQSDLYSLGIVLYELITAQLPWGGEKSLGLQQLNDPFCTLPDPRELNPSVPPQVTEVARILTAASPAARPPSAQAALKLIRKAFGETEELPTDEPPPPFFHIAFTRNDDANEVMRLGMVGWDPQQPGRYPLSLTHFAQVDSAYMQNTTAEYMRDPECTHFMLYGALLYGRRHQYWWNRVADARRRATVCASIVEWGEESAIDRAVTQLLDDNTNSLWGADTPPSTFTPFLAATGKITNPDLTHRVLALLNRITTPPPSWQNVSFSALDDMKLAELALSDESYAAEAMNLVGRARSETAVQVILNEPDRDRMMAALVAAREAAGSLPPSVPLPLQLRAAADLAGQQLSADPNALLRTYALTALGSAIGFGAYAYVAYRLPNFMDAARFLIALERGAFLGLFAGFGLFIARAVPQRLTALAPALRIGAGILIGSLAFLFSLFSYDVLFLDILPTGWAMAAGSALIASSFGLSAGLAKSKWLRMFVSGVGVTFALWLTWALHLSTRMSPILFYESSWSTAQVLGMALLTAAPIAILGNVGELDSPSPVGRGLG